MTYKKLDQLLKEYGVKGGIITTVLAYVAFFSEKLFPVPKLDVVLIEKILVFLFGAVFVALLYIFRYFERKGK